MGSLAHAPWSLTSFLTAAYSLLLLTPILESMARQLAGRMLNVQEWGTPFSMLSARIVVLLEPSTVYLIPLCFHGLVQVLP